MYRILNARSPRTSRTPFYDALRTYVLLGQGRLAHARTFERRLDARQPVGQRVLRLHGRERAATPTCRCRSRCSTRCCDPTGVIAQAQEHGRQGLRRAQDLLRDQRHLDRQQGDLPDAARAGRQDAARSQLPQVACTTAWCCRARCRSTSTRSVNRKYGLFGPVPKATILRAIDEHPDAQAADPDLLHLRRPALRPARRSSRRRTRAGHQGASSTRPGTRTRASTRTLRPTALEAGADYVTQSTHKVLSAFSQAAMIHVNDPDFDEHLFRENFNMHTSTSPQYGMIASLDVGRKQAVMEGYKLLERTLELAAELREQINSTERVPRARARRPAARRGARRRHPPRPDQDHDRHLGLAASPSTSCSRSCSSASTSRSRSRPSTR